MGALGFLGQFLHEPDYDLVWDHVFVMAVDVNGRLQWGIFIGYEPDQKCWTWYVSG